MNTHTCNHITITGTVGLLISALSRMAINKRDGNWELTLTRAFVCLFRAFGAFVDGNRSTSSIVLVLFFSRFANANFYALCWYSHIHPLKYAYTPQRFQTIKTFFNVAHSIYNGWICFYMYLECLVISLFTIKTHNANMPSIHVYVCCLLFKLAGK